MATGQDFCPSDRPAHPAPVARNPLLGLDLLRFGIRGESHRYLLRRLVLTVMKILKFTVDVLMAFPLVVFEGDSSTWRFNTTHMRQACYLELEALTTGTPFLWSELRFLTL